MIRFVEFDGPRGTLRGAVHIPENVGPPHPGVVLCHGMTGERMESTFLFVGLSRALEKAGIASLRFDFYGSGESDGDFSEMTVSGEIADALAGLDFFKSLDRIDAGRVGLLGLSLGGLVTACTLSRRPDVRAAALWSAAAMTLNRHLEKLTDGQKESLRRRGWANLSGLRLSAAFYEDLKSHRPYEEIARYRGPVLVVHGTADQAVPLVEAEGYVQALRSREEGICEQLFVDGGTHTFNDVDHRGTVYGKTVAWFRRHL